MLKFQILFFFYLNFLIRFWVNAGSKPTYEEKMRVNVVE